MKTLKNQKELKNKLIKLLSDPNIIITDYAIFNNLREKDISINDLGISDRWKEYEQNPNFSIHLELCKLQED